jgi:hypothetical protein
MRKPLMTIGVKEISEEEHLHYYHKWLYYYGGASDYCSLQEFINQYDPDSMGDVNVYSIDMCPCVMCMEENIE